MADPTLVAGARDTYNIEVTNQVPLIQYDIANQIDCIDLEASPLTQVFRSLPRAPAHDDTIRWKEDEKVPKTDTTSGSTAIAGVTLTVTNADRWTAYDLGVIVTGTAANAVFRVLSKSGSDLTVMWVTTAPTGGVPASSTLLRIGNAFPQFEQYQAPVTTKEVDVVNYVQDMRHAISASDLHIDAQYWTSPADWPYQVRKKGIEHQQDIELSILFGASLFNTAQHDHPVGASKGIKQFITSNLDTQGETVLTRAEWDQFQLDVMENSTQETGHKYWFFCSHRIHAQICGFATGLEQTRTGQTELGMRTTLYHGPCGDVLIKPLPILTGLYDGSGFLLDMQPRRFRYRYFRGKDTKLRKLQLANGYTGQVWEWRTVFSLEFHHENLHGYMSGVAAA